LIKLRKTFFKSFGTQNFLNFDVFLKVYYIIYIRITRIKIYSQHLDLVFCSRKDFWQFCGKTGISFLIQKSTGGYLSIVKIKTTFSFLMCKIFLKVLTPKNALRFLEKKENADEKIAKVQSKFFEKTNIVYNTIKK